MNDGDWNGHTYREICRAISSGRIIYGEALENLRSLIVQTLKVEKVRLCGSGSFALELALRACGVRDGDEVVIPTFCCSAVVAPILSLGATPVLADVGEELNMTVETVAAVLTKNTRAIIVPHLFGNPAGIQEIIELAHRRNIYVIDDAAQALGATIDKQPVGSFGDFGILSFGNEKICPGIGGGALVSRDREVVIEKSEARLGSAAYLVTLRECFSTLMWNRSRHWPAPLSRLRVSRSDPAALPSPYRRESMANLYAAVAVPVAENLSKYIAARRERVCMYQNLLGEQTRLKLIPHRAGSTCLTQVVRILRRERGRDFATELVEVLRAERYEVRGSYVPLHLIPRLNACVWDRLPYADRVWSDLVELPCQPSMGVGEVARIASIVAAVASG